MGQLMLYLLVFIASYLTTKLYKQYARQQGLIDIPNQRSSHQHPTVRGGGLVFVTFFAVFVIGAYLNQLIALTSLIALLPALLIGALGFWDDIASLSAKRRLQGQFLAASITVAALSVSTPLTVWGLPVIFSIPIAVFAIVWSTNLFNFMDGTDGIAATEAIFVLGTGGWLLHVHGALFLSPLCFALCAVLLGFLCLNWPKASIFMGDVGSGFLGFLIAVMALMGYVYYNISLFYWLILYSVFVWDATVTLLCRIYAKHPITAAHKYHAYQRLHQLTGSHKPVLWTVITYNTLFSIGVLASFYGYVSLLWVGIGACLLLIGGYAVLERKQPFIR
jgi:Fuc2NAc and GlcNAc transferase